MLDKIFGQEGMDAAITHKMAMTMKVRWWDMRGMSLEEIVEEGRWLNRKRFGHLTLPREF